MKDSNLKVELERIVNDLGKVDGVEGSLIVDSNGELLSQRMLQNGDISLFGPMAHVITSSSKRLLNSSNQGKIERILVESQNGKALFLHLGKVHFIVLMKNRANVGLIMVSSKRAAEKIVDLTKDLEILAVEEKVAAPKEPIPELDTKELVKDEGVEGKSVLETSKSEELVAEIDIISETEIQPELKPSGIPEEVKISEKVDDISEELKPKKELEPLAQPKSSIPVIKPPIAFPDIKKVVEVPESMEGRADLILDVYEAIFRAMSIGASKIMGVAPARGLTQKFLPLEHCKKLLDGVNVKSNSTIDFNKIRENALKMPLEDRESEFIKDFTRIIDVVTENYGKVMGYAAFRGMVRPEFRIINNSYGPVMEKMGIKNKMHPEMAELFE